TYQNDRFKEDLVEGSKNDSSPTPQEAPVDSQSDSNKEAERTKSQRSITSETSIKREGSKADCDSPLKPKRYTSTFFAVPPTTSDICQELVTEKTFENIEFSVKFSQYENWLKSVPVP